MAWETSDNLRTKKATAKSATAVELFEVRPVVKHPLE
jgi:hypothetical protein